MAIEEINLSTDVLIIGGGTAGCYAANTLAKQSELSIIIAEKSFIKRSGCLAAGVNALNAFIGPNESEDSYVEYVKKEFEDIVREDLVYSIAKKLNKAAYALEAMGLPILKNSDGSYVMRGKRSVKVNGENIKPILVNSIKEEKKIKIIEQLYIVELIKEKEKVVGAIGFSVKDNELYRIKANAIICTTGGAAGVYKPNNPKSSQHKMWYSPFNCGSGFAQGIRIGAEMTTFEMRFIALRCKDTIAPTGTIAQGLRIPQVNKNNEEYVKKYGKETTINRLYGTVIENKEGRGPCYLQTKGISKEVEEELFKAYLNMAPSQTLKWFDLDEKPSKFNVEIEGTEPYIVGGHTASGYWVDTDRRTTIKGLYAAGDVCGGSPKKYVTGCLAEAEIAAETVIKDFERENDEHVPSFSTMDSAIEQLKTHIDESINAKNQIDDLEKVMQDIMDQYAGGISTYYEYNSKDLKIAEQEIESLLHKSQKIKVGDTKQLCSLYEVIDRLYVAKVLIAHLKARKETRWKCYQSNQNYKEKNSKFNHYINSIWKDNGVHILTRQLVKKGEIYEHSYS